MTILPKKKNGQQKSDNDAADTNSHHSYHGDRLQPIAQENRERYNFSARNSPPSWPTREEKRPGHTSNSGFDEYENVDNGPSHSKRRHRASPHRSVRKTHSSHSHRNTGAPSYSTPGPSQVNQPQDRPATSSEGGTVDHTGYNSGDEYDRPAELWTEDERLEREQLFEIKLRQKGLVIKAMGEDGACLFRAVADQVYGDQEMHRAVRKLTMDYMAKNADYYSQYVTEDFDQYVQRKRDDHIHGNHIEMQAMCEMFNRPIEVYHYCSEPINIFHGGQHTDNEPIRLSYHSNVHYNSIVDPYKATVGVGLGLPQFKPGLADKNLLKDAIRSSEDLVLEQAMLEDKLRATDWEATNEAIEEQVARESYLEWLRENEVRARKKTRTATATSSSSLSSPSPPPQTTSGGTSAEMMMQSSNNASVAVGGGSSPSLGGRHSPRSRASTPLVAEHNNNVIMCEEKNPGETHECSPKAGFSGANHSNPSSSFVDQHGFSLIETASFMNQLPPSVFGLNDWEDTDILARVLAQSQQEYLDSLKRTAKDHQNSS